MIFQKHVPAVADLRVTAIGEEVYAAATAVREADYAQDVRMNLDAKYAAHDLPRETTAKLNALMERLGLVNPAGQFLYIEHATGQPIAAALAQTLLRKRAVERRGAYVPSSERRAIMGVPMPVNVKAARSR